MSKCPSRVLCILWNHKRAPASPELPTLASPGRGTGPWEWRELPPTCAHLAGPASWAGLCAPPTGENIACHCLRPRSSLVQVMFPLSQSKSISDAWTGQAGNSKRSKKQPPPGFYIYSSLCLECSSLASLPGKLLPIPQRLTHHHLL